VEAVTGHVLGLLGDTRDISVAGGDAVGTVVRQIEEVAPCPELGEVRDLMEGNLASVEERWAGGGWRIDRGIVVGIVRASFEETEKRERVVSMIQK
jgi:hypothetical protein